MNGFTYQKNTNGTPLETYEWDNPWWEHTENTTAPHVLYIGDSISAGTRPVLNTLAEGKILFDGFATSKAADNRFFISSLELYIKQTKRIDAVIFNNGLHGWHLDNAEYEKGYDKILEYLTGLGVPVFVVLSTDLPADEKRAAKVRERNEIAVSLAKKYKTDIIDLYSASLRCDGLYAPDNVHFAPEGYTVLAREILDCITEHLKLH